MATDVEGGDIGDVYYCAWERTKDGKYVGWEKKHPSLRVEVDQKTELMTKLGNAVGEHYSDFEAAIHFDPPLQTGEGHDALFVDRFEQIGWNGGFTCRPSRKTAFAGGQCEQCKWGIGPRTAAPLIVDSALEGDGAFCSIPEPGWLIIVSESFLKLLTSAERDQFEAREVKRETKYRKRFFELIPKTFVPLVAIKGLEVDGTRCEQCGRRNFAHGNALGWGVDVACRADLPSPLPPCFFVGGPTEFRMFTTRHRWRQLCGKPGTRKMGGGPLAVVEEESCERNPWLPTRDEAERIQRQQASDKWAIGPWSE